MDRDVRQAWEDFLNPQVTRARLIAASIYIAAFEALKDSIVGRIRDFYWSGFDDSGDKTDPEYQSEVLARNRSPVYASLDWLKEQGAIDAHDLATFENAKACRNILAHELLELLGSEGLPVNFDQCVTEIVVLLRKIEMWWIVNVEIPTNPEYDGVEVDEAKVLPGPVMSMQVLMDIALGDEERSRSYYDEFRRRTGNG